VNRIVHDPQRFVDEMLDGLLQAHPDQLRVASADCRAIVRTDSPQVGRVGIVTGGWLGERSKRLQDPGATAFLRFLEGLDLARRSARAAKVANTPLLALLTDHLGPLQLLSHEELVAESDVGDRQMRALVHFLAVGSRVLCAPCALPFPGDDPRPLPGIEIDATRRRPPPRAIAGERAFRCGAA
jgi:hypothetical protein